MNPNSTHQTWSRWTAVIIVPFHHYHARDSFAAEMKRATASVYRKLFGSASEMRITREFLLDAKQTRFTVECRTEGAPMQDPVFRKMRMDKIAAFFGKNLRIYGQVDVGVDVALEAGDPADGTPPAQLILAPPVNLNVN